MALCRCHIVWAALLTRSQTGRQASCSHLTRRQRSRPAVERAVEAYACETRWLEMMRIAMQRDFGWERSMGTYRDVYRRALAARA